MLPEAFKFQDRPVRTVVIDGKPWFMANDVAGALGYANPRKAITDHCRSLGVLKRYTLTVGGKQSITYISESNVYRLIAHSKLPAAEPFESWIFEEVLPAIMKEGGYILPSANAEQLEGLQAKVKELEAKLLPYQWPCLPPSDQPVHTVRGYGFAERKFVWVAIDGDMPWFEVGSITALLDADKAPLALEHVSAEHQAIMLVKGRDGVYPAGMITMHGLVQARLPFYLESWIWSTIIISLHSEGVIKGERP